METIIILTFKLILAFIILTVLYLFTAHLLISYKKNGGKQPKKTNATFEGYIALVYEGYVDESELIKNIKWLIEQDYKNYTALFFTREKIVHRNNLPNITIVNPTQTLHHTSDFIRYAKSFYMGKVDRIALFKDHYTPISELITLENEFYATDNAKSKIEKPTFMEGIVLELNSLLSGLTTKRTKKTFDSISTFQYTHACLLICSVLLIAINQTADSNTLLFHWVSIFGALFSTILWLQIMYESPKFQRHKKG
jgi:hypothetical protein